MILNGIIALILCYFTELVRLGGQLRHIGSVQNIQSHGLWATAKLLVYVAIHNHKLLISLHKAFNGLSHQHDGQLLDERYWRESCLLLTLYSCLSVAESRVPCVWVLRRWCHERKRTNEAACFITEFRCHYHTWGSTALVIVVKYTLMTIFYRAACNADAV